MRVLVIGGSGFIGRHVVEELVRRGVETVNAGFSKAPAAPKGLPGSLIGALRLNICRIEEIIDAIKTYKIDRIINLAYQMGPLCDRQPHHALEPNVIGTNNVLEAARLTDVGRVVYTSSLVYHGFQGAYGERKVKEDDLIGPPGNVYAAIKRLNEYLGLKYYENFGVEAVALRPGVVYGHGRTSVSWKSAFASYPAVGKPVTIDQDPDQPICFVYVADVAVMLANLCLAPRPAHLAYLTGGHTVTMRRMVEIVRGFVPGAEVNFSNARTTIPAIYYPDGSRYEVEFGGPVHVPLGEGVKAHINAAREEAGLYPLV